MPQSDKAEPSQTNSLINILSKLNPVTNTNLLNESNLEKLSQANIDVDEDEISNLKLGLFASNISLKEIYDILASSNIDDLNEEKLLKKLTTCLGLYNKYFQENFSDDDYSELRGHLNKRLSPSVADSENIINSLRGKELNKIKQITPEIVEYFSIIALKLEEIKLIDSDEDKLKQKDELRDILMVFPSTENEDYNSCIDGTRQRLRSTVSFLRKKELFETIFLSEFEEFIGKNTNQVDDALQIHVWSCLLGSLTTKDMHLISEIDQFHLNPQNFIQLKEILEFVYNFDTKIKQQAQDNLNKCEESFKTIFEENIREKKPVKLQEIILFNETLTINGFERIESENFFNEFCEEFIIKDSWNESLKLKLKDSILKKHPILDKKELEEVFSSQPIQLEKIDLFYDGEQSSQQLDPSKIGNLVALFKNNPVDTPETRNKDITKGLILLKNIGQYFKNSNPFYFLEFFKKFKEQNLSTFEDYFYEKSSSKAIIKPEFKDFEGIISNIIERKNYFTSILKQEFPNTVNGRIEREILEVCEAIYLSKNSDKVEEFKKKLNSPEELEESKTEKQRLFDKSCQKLIHQLHQHSIICNESPDQILYSFNIEFNQQITYPLTQFLISNLIYRVSNTSSEQTPELTPESTSESLIKSTKEQTEKLIEELISHSAQHFAPDILKEYSQQTYDFLTQKENIFFKKIIESDNAEILEKLIDILTEDKKSQLKNYKPDDDNNLLHLACISGSYKVIDVLLKMGFDINAKNNLGYTPLMTATKSSKKEVVDKLIENGADANIKGPFNYTALMFGAIQQNNLIVEKLIRHTDDINAVETFTGSNALMLASENGHFLNIRTLLNHSEIDPNLKNKMDLNALMIAMKLGNDLVVKEFLSPNVKINLEDCNRDGKTVLLMAAEKRHLNIVKLLIDSGADIYKVCNEEKNTLHYITRFDHVNKNSAKIVEILIEKGIDVNKLDKDDDGNWHYPLDYSIFGKDVSTIEVLFKNGARTTISYPDDEEIYNYEWREDNEIVYLNKLIENYQNFQERKNGPAILSQIKKFLIGYRDKNPLDQEVSIKINDDGDEIKLNFNGIKNIYGEKNTQHDSDSIELERPTKKTRTGDETETEIQELIKTISEKRPSTITTPCNMSHAKSELSRS